MADKQDNGGTSAKLPQLIAPMGFETLIEVQRPALAAVGELNSRLYDGIAAMSREWMSLLDRRLREDLAMPEQLAACKTARDMYRLYVDYFQNAFSHYQSGFEQLTKCGLSMAEDAFDVLRLRAEPGTRRKK
jgi:Phasin protein